MTLQRIRTIFILLVLANLTIGFIGVQGWAETPVIGFIAQDTTWTQANSPYVTLGNIIVKEGVTLTIEPGVTIQFDDGHSLTIEGTLIARGTDKQGNDISGSILQYCTVQFAKTAVNGNATISNNTLTGNTADGKSAFGGGVCVEGGITTISNNTITENRIAYSFSYDGKVGGTAIYYKGNEEITGNFISNNVATTLMAIPHLLRMR